jgi:SAM-dependent methyltransferase
MLINLVTKLSRYSFSLNLGKLRLLKSYLSYKKQKNLVPIMQEIDIMLNGDSSASPIESFSHYDAFYFWIANDIASKSGQKILDLGGKKIMNGWLSVLNDVYSVNLTAPIDSISNVNYVVTDATKALPFPNAYFDTFISPVSINLIGLGRYGDSVDASAIPNLITELDRVMKKDSALYISVVYGFDKVMFNHHVVLSFATIEKLFQNWKIDDFLIDHQETYGNDPQDRFTKNLDTDGSLSCKNENVIFLRFGRKLD